MALLAMDAGRRYTNQEMAGMLKASSHHLAKVLQRLAKVGLVDSTRGPSGGFQLGKPPEQTSLLEIYEAVEGPVDTTGCLFSQPVCDGGGCIVGEAVQSTHNQLRDYLKKTTLLELAQSIRPLVTIDG